MNKKVYCATCAHFDLDTSHWPSRHSCALHNRRVDGNEVPDWCNDYMPLSVRAQSAEKPVELRRVE